MAAEPDDFYERLAANRAEHEIGYWAHPDYVRESPAITGGSETRGSWYLRKFGHVNVCREPAVDTLLADSIRAGIRREDIASIVFKYNRRVRGRFREDMFVVAEQIQDTPHCSWALRWPQHLKRAVGWPLTMEECLETMREADCWVVHIELREQGATR